MKDLVPYYLRGDNPEDAEVNAARLAIGLPINRFADVFGGFSTGARIVCRCIHCGALFASKSHNLGNLDHICRGDCGRHGSGTSAPSPGDEVRAPEPKAQR